MADKEGMRLCNRLILSAVVCAMLFCPMAHAQDFIVEFISENYKQTNQEYSTFPEVYHSIQVNSIAGPKILVLGGTDHEYRTWLRQYISQGRGFIVKVPDDQNDLFISSKAFKIDVAAVHPFDRTQWKSPERDAGWDALELTGGNRIIIVDTDDDRSRLVASVITDIGYAATVIRDAGEALRTFTRQPEKFDMIIVNHQIQGMTAEHFVRQVIDIDHRIPVLIGAGYNNRTRLLELSNRFSDAGSVTVVPVVLRDLRNRVKSILNRKA